MPNEIDFPSTIPADNIWTDSWGTVWDYVAPNWVKRTVGIVEELDIGGTPTDNIPYARNYDSGGDPKGTWVQTIERDPGAAGIKYVRQDDGWVSITDVATGVTDAVSDGTAYVREDGVWRNIVSADVTDLTATLDAHVGTLAANISDEGAMAYENDAADASQYVRTLGAWVPYNEAAGVIHKASVTIMRPEATDDATLFYTSAAITIGSIWSHPRGAGASVTFNVVYNNDRDVAGTNIFTANQVSADASYETHTADTTQIAGGNWLWLDITAIAFEPEMFHLTIEYTID